jgi:hypothetical protein
MIIAGWLLAILGLAQVVYAATLDVTQLEAGNPLLGLAPSIVVNANLLAQRTMIHTGGCITFLAGAVFIAAAYLKPPPTETRDRAWTSFGAVAAGVFLIASLIGSGLFVYTLQHRNAGQAVADAQRLKQARAQTTARMLKQAEGLAASGGVVSGGAGEGGPAD